MNKANGRQSSKQRAHYDAQWARTRKNKMKRVLRSSGARALDAWSKANPLHIPNRKLQKQEAS